MLEICAGIRSNNPLLTITWFSEMEDEDHCAGRCIPVKGFAIPLHTLKLHAVIHR
jgi:hypothetical protein